MACILMHDVIVIFHRVVKQGGQHDAIVHFNSIILSFIHRANAELAHIECKSNCSLFPRSPTERQEEEGRQPAAPPQPKGCVHVYMYV